jgi:iron complex outermembrane recepter protein
MGVVRLAALAGVAAAALGAVAPAAAQRTGENAVTQAGDAFGSSVGNERVGIYNAGNARGFSPAQAGNMRIEGLYFDQQADLDARISAGAAMRVGIAAQSYPFSSPTGIADFSLRKPGSEAMLSLVAGLGPYGGARIEADGQLPLTGTLALAGGIGLGHDETHYGADRTILNSALVLRWRPAPGAEIVPFAARYSVSGTEAQPVYFTGGPWLPPEIARRRFYGPSWARNATQGSNAGLLVGFAQGGWTARGGLFRSVLELDRTFTELALNMDRQGIADRYIQAEADRRFASTSGEVRLTRSLEDGPRVHLVHAALRGREQTRLYGGGRLIALGRGPIDVVADPPQPDLTVGPQTRDTVRQLTLGLGYEARWRGVGELAVSLQKTDYRKDVARPDGRLPTSAARPWLLGATLAAHASPRLTFYAGYTRGLEESPVAPSVARNRDEAAPALITEQMDAGLRAVLPGGMRLVAGLFQVSKPYFGLDETLLFDRLGSVRHRGAELSLSGSPLPGVTAIVGTVFLDAELTGEAVESGRIGRRPVGTFVRYTNAALDWRLPFAPGLSLDIAYESTSRRVADRANSFFIPARFVFALGGRYRFDLDGRPATLRVQMGSVNGNYGWSNIGEGFHYNLPRRISVTLSTDV